MVTIEQIQRGVKSYVDSEIGRKATGFRKFGIYFMLPSIDKYTTKYVEQLKELMPDKFDENGNVNIDEVYNCAKTAIKRSGSFELMGIIFNETDIDKLYTYINKGENML